MGRAAGAALVSQWRTRIGRWRRSGLSVAEFCRQEQVSQPSFFSWRKRLSPQLVNTNRRSRRTSVRRDRRPGFVQLPAARWPGSEEIRIALPGGAIVTLPLPAAAELVTTAIRAAMREPSGAAEDRLC